MTITASISSSQGGDTPGQWSLEYDDVTQRVTGEANGAGNAVVDVQINKVGGTRRVSFVQPGRPAFPNSDFTVVFNADPTLIGPSIAPAQVARIIGKIGTVNGGLPFEESWSRT